MGSVVSSLITKQEDARGIIIEPHQIYDGVRYSLRWSTKTYGSVPVIDATTRKLSETSLVHKWLNVEEVIEKVHNGINRTRDRVRRWRALPSEARTSTITLAATTFVEDLSGPTYSVASFACTNLKAASSPFLQTCEPYAYAIASTAAVIGASEKIKTTARAYMAIPEPKDDHEKAIAQEKKRALLIKLAKAIAIFAIGILGILALRFGPIYSTVSLTGVSVLYTLGIYEDNVREKLPSLPAF